MIRQRLELEVWHEASKFGQALYVIPAHFKASLWYGPKNKSGVDVGR